MTNEKTLDISWATIFKIVIASLSFYLIFLVRNILVLIIFALIISILFNSAINFIQKRRVPRVVATILVYISFFAIFGFLLYLILPAFLLEIKQFSQLFPQYFEKLSPPLKAMGVVSFSSFEIFVQSLQDWLVKASSNIFSAISAFFGGIVSTVIIFIIAVFFSLEEKSIEKAIGLFSPKKHEAYILSLWEKSQAKVTGWFGVRLLGSVFVGIVTFIACKILAIDYAAFFAILAGVTNIVPVIGPIIAGIIIGLFTAIDSWSKSLFVLIAFILIQQVENNILTPILVKRFIGISPVLVLVALLIGGKLWGVLGALLAVPLAGMISEFLRDYLKKREEEKTAIPQL